VKIVQEFRVMYSEALTYGFSALGKQLANVVRDYLARKYNLTPIETYRNPKLIYEALEKSLGFGSIIVETRIIKSLYSQLSLSLEGELRIRMGHPEDFERYVFEIQEKIEGSS
jgi:hypothetical protein